MYTVRSGDSMSAIAARHGVGLSQLVQANPQVRNPSLIHPGQALNIPGRADTFEAARPSPGQDLRRGQSGASVRELQNQLVRLGYMTAGQMATGPGIFGPITDGAVRAFQRDHSLQADGVVGPFTRGALKAALERPDAPTPPSTPHPPVVNPGQYDGTRPAAGTTRTDAWNAVDAPLQNRQGNRSATNYAQVLNQFAVGVNPRYARRDGNTYCNIFVWDATRAMGAEIPHWVNGREMNANANAQWLRSSGPANGWRKVSASEAQSWANNGHPAVASWENPGGIGHIAMVRPGSITSRGPASAQAGGSNFNDGHIADGFGSRQPEYWVHA